MSAAAHCVGLQCGVGGAAQAQTFFLDLVSCYDGADVLKLFLEFKTVSIRMVCLRSPEVRRRGRPLYPHARSSPMGISAYEVVHLSWAEEVGVGVEVAVLGQPQISSKSIGFC